MFCFHTKTLVLAKDYSEEALPLAKNEHIFGGIAAAAAWMTKTVLKKINMLFC
jgi:hypothetical protein